MELTSTSAYPKSTTLTRNYLCNVKYIHSFRPFLERLFKSTTTQKRPRHSTDTVPEFRAEAPLATASDGLAQGPYVAAIAGFKLTTLRLKGIDSTNASPRPTTICIAPLVASRF